MNHRSGFRFEPVGQGRQQDDRTQHVEEEHEGQEDAHVGLELDR